jgi:hypothetical protein
MMPVAQDRQFDNSTFALKRALRRKVLGLMKDPPVILETHGGAGALWLACYQHVPAGVVFEKDPGKADILAAQRPTWAVYEGDCIPALTGGAGAHLMVNLLDVDPYGSPWGAIDAFLSSDRPRAEILHIVVNDGARHKIRLGGAWAINDLTEAVYHFGNAIWEDYLEVCQWFMKQKAGKAGYSLAHFGGYHCGAGQQMTHYRAVLKKALIAEGAPAPVPGPGDIDRPAGLS